MNEEQVSQDNTCKNEEFEPHPESADKIDVHSDITANGGDPSSSDNMHIIHQICEEDEQALKLLDQAIDDERWHRCQMLHEHEADLIDANQWHLQEEDQDLPLNCISQLC